MDKEIEKVKNKLCKIEDILTAIFIRQDISERTKNALIVSRKGIDDCVYKLEKILVKNGKYKKELTKKQLIKRL